VCRSFCTSSALPAGLQRLQQSKYRSQLCLAISPHKPVHDPTSGCLHTHTHTVAHLRCSWRYTGIRPARMAAAFSAAHTCTRHGREARSS